ncbi:MAG: hypothetical protein AB8B97_11460 [Granulosicoccus sp.]
MNAKAHVEAKDAANKTGEYLVSVTGGLACGAAFRLSPGQRLLVGSDLKSDIVLPDPSARGCELALTGTDSGVLVEALAGDILLDGDTLPTSTEVNGEDRKLTLGEAQLWIQAPDHRVGSDSYDGDSPALHPVPDTQVEPESLDTSALEDIRLSVTNKGENGTAFNEGETLSKAETLTVHPDVRKRSWSVPLAMILGPLLACGVYLIWKYSDYQAVTVNTPTLAAVLEEPDFAGLSVSTIGEISTLSGRLQSREQAKKLDVMLKALPQKINNNTHIADQLLAQVNEIFRVNGESIKASFTADGEVLVDTRIANPDRLEHLRKVVIRDVPELAGLVINNKPPPSALKPGTAPVVQPGKRVALVVSDDPAYVVTEDASRYFVGAILPSGHRIRSIEDGRVSIEMQGLITELEF